MYRRTFAKVDCKILKENVKEIEEKYNNYKYYFGVVKGNAYGHGDYVVNSLIDGGINYLAVSSLEEGISIRKYNKTIPILCLEPINLDYLNIIIDNNITITVESLIYIKKLISLDFNKNIRIHLKLNTGMNRLGFNKQCELEDAISLIKTDLRLLLEGIYTHLATSGINDIYYDKQINTFKQLTKNINLSDIPIIHIGRSMTLVNHEKLDFVNGIRLGICMYGFNNSISNPTGLRKIKRWINNKRLHISETKLSNELKLKSAFSLYSEVMSLRNVKKGEFVGYGAKYIAKEDIIVATLPIGYFDGINKQMKYVSINNKKYEIIGEICMDMTLIKVDETVKLNDIVEIFGKNIPIKEVAARMNSNVYKVLTSISNRVPRLYDDKEIRY